MDKVFNFRSMKYLHLFQMGRGPSRKERKCRSIECFIQTSVPSASLMTPIEFMYNWESKKIFLFRDILA